MTNYYSGIVKPSTVTIASGASLSDAIDLSGKEVVLSGLRLLAIEMPAAWTAADLTFQASMDGGTTYTNMYNADGDEITVTAAASRFIVLDPATFCAVTNIKIRSGTSASAVNQVDAVTLTLVLRAV